MCYICHHQPTSLTFSIKKTEVPGSIDIVKLNRKRQANLISPVKASPFPTQEFWAEDEKYWPLMPPLPSYGYGREHPGPRYGSLIHGQHLTDVVITEEVSFAANGIVAAGLRAFSLA
ncbi:hypothetical protein JHK84_042969 [Glycine max]|nr:hypothetical protein JHK84_042969 [Glycine max]